MNIWIDATRLRSSAGATAVVERVAALVSGWQTDADALDREQCFPVAAFQALRECGALQAPLPCRFGGLGLGTEPAGGRDLLDLLRHIGRGSLAIGRLYEGHVNALKLIALYGSEGQMARAAEDVVAGHLFALWNTEPRDGLQLIRAGSGWSLQGRKICCSGAGYATRALVTASRGDTAPEMLVISLEPGQAVGPERIALQGMRACATGTMILDDIAVGDDAIVGRPGDYLRQPVFSAGAWRTSAVTLGGLEALIEAMRVQLVGRGRDGNPHQRGRVGRAMIAQETARLWLEKAARLAEEGTAESGDTAEYVNLARIAVESACLEAMQLVQRALGLDGFRVGNPVERIMRDLATYLRQPAPDETLDEAAGWFMQRALPDA